MAWSCRGRMGGEGKAVPHWAVGMEQLPGWWDSPKLPDTALTSGGVAPGMDSDVNDPNPSLQVLTSLTYIHKFPFLALPSTFTTFPSPFSCQQSIPQTLHNRACRRSSGQSHGTFICFSLLLDASLVCPWTHPFLSVPNRRLERAARPLLLCTAFRREEEKVQSK